LILNDTICVYGSYAFNWLTTKYYIVSYSQVESKRLGSVQYIGMQTLRFFLGYHESVIIRKFHIKDHTMPVTATFRYKKYTEKHKHVQSATLYITNIYKHVCTEYIC